MKKKPIYKRVLLKLTGEAFGSPRVPLDNDKLNYIVEELLPVIKMGVELGVVVGAGNIIRGAELSEGGAVERVDADKMGMLGTAINALFLHSALVKRGVKTEVQSAIRMDQICAPFIHLKALKHLNEKQVLIFAGGTGDPYRSTDSAAILRALEMKADALLKGTKVEGIFTDDPMKNSNAQLIREINHFDALIKNLKFMDRDSIGSVEQFQRPIHVFNIFQKGNLIKVILGDTRIGSKVS